ncbi:hypothetical protein PV325_011245, partial [Microctonus aethiopoides]
IDQEFGAYYAKWTPAEQGGGTWRWTQNIINIFILLTTIDLRMQITDLSVLLLFTTSLGVVPGSAATLDRYAQQLHRLRAKRIDQQIAGHYVHQGGPYFSTIELSPRRFVIRLYTSKYEADFFYSIIC